LPDFFPNKIFAYFQFNACFDKTAILDGLDMVKPLGSTARPGVAGFTVFHRRHPSAVLEGIYDPDRRSSKIT